MQLNKINIKNTFTFIEQHRIRCRPIFAHYIISGRNRAFDLSSGSDSRCRVWAEITRPHPTLELAFSEPFIHGMCYVHNICIGTFIFSVL